MGSLIIYFYIFFLGTFFLKYKSKNILNFQNFIGILILIIFAAGRYKVGTDIQTYLNIFERYSNSSWNEIIFEIDKEWLFVIIAKITYSVGGRVLTWGTYAALIVLPTYFTLRKQYPKCDIETSFFAFLCFFYAVSFNVTRQFIAVSIVFWGMRFIYENSFYKFLGIVLLAVGFHSSAIVALSLWFLWDHKKNISIEGNKKYTILFIVLLSVIGYQFVIEQFTRNVEFFLEYSEYAKGNSNGQNRSLYLEIFELILMLILKKYFCYKDKRIDLMYILFTISVLIGVTGFYHPQVKRIAYYFSFPSKIIIFGYLPYAFKENSRWLSKFFLYLYSFTIFIIIAYILKQANLIPYYFNLFSK